MEDSSINLLDDCLTSLHTKQVQQRGRWRDAAARGSQRRAQDAPRKDLLRRPGGKQPAPPQRTPLDTRATDVPSPVLAARAAKARGYRYSLDDDDGMAPGLRFAATAADEGETAKLKAALRREAARAERAAPEREAARAGRAARTVDADPLDNITSGRRARATGAQRHNEAPPHNVTRGAKRAAAARRPTVVAPVPVLARPARDAKPAPPPGQPSPPQRHPPRGTPGAGLPPRSFDRGTAGGKARRPSLTFRPAPPAGTPSPPKPHAPRGPPRGTPPPGPSPEYDRRRPSLDAAPSPTRFRAGGPQSFDDGAASFDSGLFDADRGGGLFDAAAIQPKARRTRDARVNPLFSETGPRQLPGLARPGPPEQPPEVARALARHRRPAAEPSVLLGPDGRPLRTPKSVSTPADPLENGALAASSDPLAQKVAGLERGFGKAIDDWLAEHASASPQMRERFADHLTQQYMCSALDGLPSTDAVRAVRRRVAAKIELVAAGVREPKAPSPVKRTAPWRCPACGRTNEPEQMSCTVCQRSAPDGPVVDPALVKSIGAMKRRSDAKATEIQGLMADTEGFLKKLRDRNA